ncbi:hypothetical protein ESTG_01609 [Escherichia coli B799]|nr:hypothetical protein ESTG_01609 [Escherichia coli B799]
MFKPLDTEEVCYDNSIHYTDSLLGQVFTMLETRRASVMYFSDHGLEYDPTKEHAYFHGGIKPSQQAYHVPMFIWYSPALAKWHLNRSQFGIRIDHDLAAFFKVVVAFCNKITLCSLFFWIQVNF